MIRGYFDFINESKKEDAVEALKKMLKDKPVVKDKGKPSDARFNDYSDRYPQKIKGIYAISDMKRYLRDKGYTSDHVDHAFHVLKNDKEFKMDSVKVKNYMYSGENVPHFYTDMTKEEANKIKKESEDKSKELNQDRIEKRKEQAKKRKEMTKTTKRKKK